MQARSAQLTHSIFASSSRLRCLRIPSVLSCRGHTTAQHRAKRLMDAKPAPVDLPRLRKRGRESQEVHVSAEAAANGHGDFDFDLFTIGGGTAGVRAARLSAQMGVKVGLCELPFALIQTDREGGTGGTCVLRGCVPKKLLHYIAGFVESWEDAEGSGWDLGPKPKINWGKVMELKNKELKRLSELYKNNLVKAGVKFIEGRGKVTGPNSVEVNGKQYTARNILIATGCKAVKVPIEGSEHGIISDDVLSLERIPERMAIIGSSYIACEQASIYQNLGTDVHLINRGDLVLKGFDEEGRRFIQNIYQEKGITLHSETSPTKLTKGEDGKITLRAEKKSGEEVVLDGIDEVLFATGRNPNTKNIGLEEIGVEFDKKGGVKVDEYSRSVSVPSIWAIGDVSNRIPLTPVARMEGNMLAQHLFGKEDRERFKPNYEDVAKVVFSSPAFASVGMTEDEAVDAGHNLKIFTSEFTPMQSTLSHKKGSKALAKLVVDSATDKVLGAHMVGPEAAEIIQGLAVVVKQGLTKEQLDATVGLHPTAAEEFVTMSLSRKREAKKSH